MNTIAASTRRVPRNAVIGIAVLIAAFAVLMVVRAGVIGGSATDSTPVATPSQSSPVTRSQSPQTAPTRPSVVLLPGLPARIASKLRYSKVVVVSLYTGTAAGDRAAVAQARSGAREVGAGFTAINVLDEKQARSVAAFGGPVDSPAVLVVRRPGRIVTQFTGAVDGKIVAQAAHNAGARRRRSGLVFRESAPPTGVFRYEARHDGRTIVVLHGVQTPTGGLDVETEAYPIGLKPEEPPLRRTFSFPTHEKARRFADEVLTALEYQNCLVDEQS